MDWLEKLLVCYVVNGKEYVIRQSDENMRLIPVVTKHSENELEISLTIDNCSTQDILLKYATLWECTKESEMHIGETLYEVYRSGRHKNDMPGTFTLGVADERMKDVLGAMTESGDKAEVSEVIRKVNSDHLTVIKGSERSLLVAFTGGRKQLFETVLSLDNDFQFKNICANVFFNIVLPAGQSVESETLKLVWTNQVETEIERYAVDKVKQFKTTERQWKELLVKSPYVIDSKEGGVWVPEESIYKGRFRGEIFPDDYDR